MTPTAKQRRPGRRWAEGITFAVDWPQCPDNLGDQPVHDWVYATLRQMILYNQIAPGSWLRQKDISAQFQVSRTPVREAFRSLSQEGLVELVPNQGARVSELSIEEFEEIYALRIGIESLAVRLTAQTMQPKHLPQFQQQLDELEKLTLGSDLRQYLKQEWQFRVDCYKITQRQRMLKQVLYLREHSERYIYLAYGADTRIAESFNFHRQLLEAFARQDAQQSEAIISSALRWTLKNAGPIVATSLHHPLSNPISAES